MLILCIFEFPFLYFIAFYSNFLLYIVPHECWHFWCCYGAQNERTWVLVTFGRFGFSCNVFYNRTATYVGDFLRFDDRAKFVCKDKGIYLYCRIRDCYVSDTEFHKFSLNLKCLFFHVFYLIYLKTFLYIEIFQLLTCIIEGS